MKISNINTAPAIKNVEKSQGEMSTSINKISSGKSLSSFSENSAEAASVNNLKNEKIGLNVFEKNANSAISYMQVSEGSLNEVSSILGRMKELAAQGSNGDLSNTERNMISKEIEQLNGELDRISETTKFNNQHLLNGSGENVEFLIGNPSVGDNKVNFDFSKLNTSSRKLGVSGASVSSQSSAESLMTNVDDALEVINDYRGSVSAFQSRLTFSLASINSEKANKEVALSKIEDLDYAKETSSLAASSIKAQAGISVLSQANFNKSQILKLL